MLVQVDPKKSAPGDGAFQQGPLARYTDTNNWLLATLHPNRVTGDHQIVDPAELPDVGKLPAT
jgi:hypothetical protein